MMLLRYPVLAMAELNPPRLLPPHYFLMSLLAVGLLAWVEPRPPLLSPPWQYLGLLPAATGLLLTLAGARQFGRAGTNIVPFTPSSALVTDGVFGWSRNPMYVGMGLFLAGCCLLANQGLAWVVPLAFFVIVRQRFVLPEEALMRKTFGDAFASYQARVRRWL